MLVRKELVLMSSTRHIGIIAGNGVYPSTFARAARAQSESIQLHVAAFENETDESLIAPLVDSIEWFRVGQDDSLLQKARSHGSHHGGANCSQKSFRFAS
jgi:DUF1009 family protein